MSRKLYGTTCQLPTGRGASGVAVHPTDISLDALAGPKGVQLVQLTLASSAMPGGYAYFQTTPKELREILGDLLAAIPKDL